MRKSAGEAADHEKIDRGVENFRQRVQAALALLESLPGTDATKEEQLEEIRRLEESIAHKK